MKSQDIIDQAIENALVRDSQALPKFATTPNSALTAKLVISIGSRGLLSIIGAKVTLLGMGLVVAAGALYFLPAQKTEQQVAPKLQQSISQPAIQSVMDSTPRATKTKSHRTHVQAMPTIQSPATSASPTRAANTMQAAQSNGPDSIPRIKKPTYERPLK